MLFHLILIHKNGAVYSFNSRFHPTSSASLFLISHNLSLSSSVHITKFPTPHPSLASHHNNSTAVRFRLGGNPNQRPMLERDVSTMWVVDQGLSNTTGMLMTSLGPFSPWPWTPFTENSGAASSYLLGFTTH